MERRGFTAKQIDLLQGHDEWSVQQVSEIRVDGDRWILWQGMDHTAPTPTHDFGQITVTDHRVRMEDGSCLLVLSYRLVGKAMRLSLIDSTCDEDPTQPIPDFMYAAVFGGSFKRTG